MTKLKVIPHKQGVKMEIILTNKSMPEIQRPKLSERDIEMIRKGFVAGRIGVEGLEEFLRKLE